MATTAHTMDVPAGQVKVGDEIKVRGSYQPVVAVRQSRSGEGVYLDTPPKPEGASTFKYTDEPVRVRRYMGEFPYADVLSVLIHRYSSDLLYMPSMTDVERGDAVRKWTKQAKKFIETTINGPED